MKNRLSDLNDHLFAMLEGLSDAQITGDKLKEEIARAEAVVKVSDQIVSNANLVFKAASLVAEHSGKADMPRFLLEGKPE